MSRDRHGPERIGVMRDEATGAVVALDLGRPRTTDGLQRHEMVDAAAYDHAIAERDEARLAVRLALILNGTLNTRLDLLREPDDALIHRGLVWRDRTRWSAWGLTAKGAEAVRVALDDGTPSERVCPACFGAREIAADRPGMASPIPCPICAAVDRNETETDDRNLASENATLLRLLRRLTAIAPEGADDQAVAEAQRYIAAWSESDLNDAM